MATFLLQRTVPLPLGEAWRRLTEWHRHGDVVPFTRIRIVTAGPTREGTRFVARTGLGPLGFDDPMDVTRWEPPGATEPGRCRLEKRGRVMTGWAEIEVRPGPGGRTRVVWHEEVCVRFVPRALDGLVGLAGRYLFGRAMNRLLRTP
ncbi:SRPBCC family protein [Streptomyces sp. NPDC056628]|uniref:SRPBCC family protein n=1 Tax=Streptomyces sp. NPDC056628 TaxID=3345882 RepID=UPI003697144F